MWQLDYKEGWGLKNWCFKLWCWRRLFSVPWTARGSNYSMLKEFNPEYSLEGLRLMVFLLAILIPACDSSSLAFHMMYSAYKLNKQGDNIQPYHTPLPILKQSFVPCLVLSVASWPAYSFLRRQVRWSGIPNSLIIFHCLLWSTQSKASV